VTYIKNLPDEPFRANPKPFFGFSDNSHFANHLWRNGVPSYYGGSLFCEFARTPRMDPFTVGYLRKALFESGEVALTASTEFNDIGIDWADPAYLTREKFWEANPGWFFDGAGTAEGITWGGCLESIDEMLRCATPLPTLDQFEEIILIAETSEEIPDEAYVRRMYRALGERGILQRLRGVLVGRPKSWEFGRERDQPTREQYRAVQRAVTLKTIRSYNATVPVVQNLDFGHTSPQICMPYGAPVRIDCNRQEIVTQF
jgi:muramoyltetrapeptide carboxypeptidase LdcA involved in peptidoglycan recycling